MLLDFYLSAPQKINYNRRSTTGPGSSVKTKAGSDISAHFITRANTERGTKWKTMKKQIRWPCHLHYVRLVSPASSALNTGSYVWPSSSSVFTEHWKIIQVKRWVLGSPSKKKRFVGLVKFAFIQLEVSNTYIYSSNTCEPQSKDCNVLKF